MAAKKRTAARSAESALTPDIERIKSALVELINIEVRERLGPGTIEISALLPLPDGGLVPAEDATPEQWQATSQWLLEDTLEKAASGIDTLVQLAISRAHWQQKSTPLSRLTDERHHSVKP